MTGHFKYIYPPRPKGKVDPNLLPTYEAQNKWLVQRKFNGQRNLIHVNAKGYVFLYGQDGEPHQNFIPSKYLIDEISSLGFHAGLEYWLDSELLHAKTSTSLYKSKIIVFDLLQFEGKYMFMSPTLIQRQRMLFDFCGQPAKLEPGGLAFEVTPHVFLAESWTNNFMSRYKDHIEKPEIEGLVLKRKDSVLDSYGKSSYEVDWQIRCRKPSGKYQR